MPAGPSTLEILVGLLLAVVPLVALARRLDIAYPIVLVLGGVALSFIPGLPTFTIPPNVVLTVLLPPILYWTAITAPTNAIRDSLRWIAPLAVGLVLATAATVAGVAHAVLPGLAWPAAFVLGAIVSPTDEAAFLPVAERLKVPRRIVAIIEGESLLNDATALVLFSVATQAVATGHTALLPAVWKLVWASAGAVLYGTAVGRVVAAGWARVRDPQLQGVISLTLPYLAYLPADRIGVSGVLAVVTVGLVVGRRTPRFLAPRARIQLTGYYETVLFIVNVVIFVAVGLQLRRITQALDTSPHADLIRDALLVCAAVIITRFVWVFGQLAIANTFCALIGRPRTTRAGAHTHYRPVEWNGALITAWSGLRGGISLAAALAIPTTTAAGAPFPGRDLFVFLTYVVILVTLVGQGLTLPVLIRWLHLEDDGAEAHEEAVARRTAARVALERLRELERRGDVPPEVLDVYRRRYERRHEIAAVGDDQCTETMAAECGPQTNPTRLAELAEVYRRVGREILDAQRNAVIGLREQRQIDNTVLRRIQEGIDLEQLQLDRLPGAESPLDEDDDHDESDTDDHTQDHADDQRTVATHSAGSTSRPT